MNILIVGAGAVGQVYGYHFQRDGHQITYLVKEKYLQNLRHGMVLYHLNKDKSLKQPLTFNDYQLVSEWPEYTKHHFDLIVLTIPSTALRQLPFHKISACSNNKTPILMLQPSEEDLAILRDHMPHQPIAEGMISLIAYQTPLIDENNPTLSQQPGDNGIAYYLPPMKMPLSSIHQSLAKRLVSLFQHSKISAKRSHSAIDDSKLASAFLMTFLCSLEAADWNMKRLYQNKQLLTELSQAQRFLLPQRIKTKVIRHIFSMLFNVALRPWFYRLMIKLAPHFVPLPLEAYLRFHFGKVRSQTMLYMRDYIAEYPDQRLITLLKRVEAT